MSEPTPPAQNPPGSDAEAGPSPAPPPPTGWDAVPPPPPPTGWDAPASDANPAPPWTPPPSGAGMPGPMPGWPPPGGYGPSPGGYGPSPGAYGPPGAYPPYGAPSYGGPRTESLAIVALVLAIASFVICPVIPAIVALVLASSAKRGIANSGGMLGGQGLVTAARIVAWCNIGLAVLVVGLIVLLAVFGHSSASVTTNNVTVVGHLFL